MQNNKGINIHPNKVMAALKHFQSRNKTHSTEHSALSTLKFPNQERQPNLNETFSSSHFIQHHSLYFPFIPKVINNKELAFGRIASHIE